MERDRIEIVFLAQQLGRRLLDHEGTTRVGPERAHETGKHGTMDFQPEATGNLEEESLLYTLRDSDRDGIQVHDHDSKREPGSTES